MSLYDYVFLGHPEGPTGRAALIETAAHLRPEDDVVVGVFAPQLGWRASETAVLLERRAGSGGETARALAPGAAHSRLRPTLRPDAGTRLRPGGIFVHRTFQVHAGNLTEFVDLSGAGWEDFEPRFEAQVFGLFEVMAPRADPDLIELLLITRYASHGVWELSRDPTTAAMRTFARRAALTVATRACSSLLVWSSAT